LRAQAMEVDRRYLADLVQTAIHLGLSEDQESALLDLAQHAHRQLDSLRDDEFSTGDRLQRIAERIRELAGEQGTVL
ncbi:hypothetical protein JZU54_07840, partial [bacterium]|nr:hypothetical protein [bacterium]